MNVSERATRSCVSTRRNPDKGWNPQTSELRDRKAEAGPDDMV